MPTGRESKQGDPVRVAEPLDSMAADGDKRVGSLLQRFEIRAIGKYRVFQDKDMVAFRQKLHGHMVSLPPRAEFVATTRADNHRWTDVLDTSVIHVILQIPHKRDPFGPHAHLYDFHETRW